MRLATATAASLVLIALVAAPAVAAGERYAGETGDGHAAKLVTDRDGAVIRGAFTTETHCTAGYDPFRARFEVHRPLDRSSRDRFRDAGSNLQRDERFSARYRYEVKGKRRGPNVLKGAFDLTIVFRKKGEEYTTCTAEQVKFEVRRTGSD